MSHEIVNAAAALIRVLAGQRRRDWDMLESLGETEAAQRQQDIADGLERAAELLRADAEPKYDAKAAAANVLASRVWQYTSAVDADSPAAKHYYRHMVTALEEFDDADD